MPTISELWDKIKHRSTRVPRFARIPADHVLTPLPTTAAIVPQKTYFGIVVDELFLEDERQWRKEYDAMVVAMTEFIHGGKTVSLPFVVGPKLLGDSGTPVPQGMLYKQTRVAGVHPFRGGRVTSTVVLCQVQRADYAKRLLSFVESVASAVPFAAELGTYVKYANSLLDGIDAMLGAKETQPLVGIRQEFDFDLGSPISPGYFVLVDGPEEEFSVQKLWVRDSTLLFGDSKERAVPFRKASYVLFSNRGSAMLSGLDTLSFYPTVISVTELSASPDPQDWERAKAELVVLLRQLLTSPDLTREQALVYHTQIIAESQAAHEHAGRIKSLRAATTEDQDELRRSADLLKLP